MKKIIQFFTWLRQLLFPTQIERANKKLLQATKLELKKRNRLRKEIERFVSKKFGYKFGSKYIPNKGFNKALIYDNVNEHFGTEMADINIKLTKSLTWR